MWIVELADFARRDIPTILPYIEVSQQLSGESAVLEMGEDECGLDGRTELAGAGGDVLEGAPGLSYPIPNLARPPRWGCVAEPG
ncbi:hypothetical protein Atai01_56300 [Amycolatopsis taiwanensis]|uniref:Uncharacterized protein n=1 Tax=Amycolatopsis taiwanensis TaxID=342230 RepID=A0A9W6R3V1_9PSEU|nr:hypothetical protein Atai01_56300 [Amycolatopsis taiwanensis]